MPINRKPVDLAQAPRHGRVAEQGRAWASYLKKLGEEGLVVGQ
jgi:hypothetical protein